VKNNNNINDDLKFLDELNDSLEIPYNKSSEEVWETVQQKIERSRPKVHRLNFRQIRIIWAAAIIILLIGSGVAIRFFHYTVKSEAGQMAEFFLPDGSKVTLSAQSEVTYFPLWWSIERKVKLKGEAFFKVQKGKQFSVKSNRGITSVLGTSFDIYARPDNYRVVCYTGRVKVEARKSNKKIVLTPGEKAEINREGEISFSKEAKTGQYVAWLNKQYVFTSAPLAFVFGEMARRYNVSITLQYPVTGSYTGNFPASMPVEQALSIVCKPFGLTFVKKDSNHFVIKKIRAAN